MIKNMYLVIFTLISFGAPHFSYTMEQTNLTFQQKVLTTLICSKIDEIMEPIESKAILLHKPIAASEIKKTKSLPSIIIYHCKDYATMNNYKTC